MKKKLTLPVQIVIALAAGILLGFICYEAGASDPAEKYLKPLGTIFINLLKLLVVPVVLLSMIDGIISLGDIRKIGSIGWKAVLYFLATTVSACIGGLIFANIFRNAGLFPVLDKAAGETWKGAAPADLMTMLAGVFPDNLWKAFSEADILQVMVISLLFGGAILAAGEKGRFCRDLVSSGYSLIEKMMAFMIRLSPIGVFAMMTWVVAAQGPRITGSLAFVILCAYLAYAVHALLIYSFSAKFFAGISPAQFFRGAFPAMAFAFASTSSAAALPVTKECAAELGADEDIAAFVLPLGSVLNMDGTAIYQCAATVFLAGCCGIHLSPGQMVLVAAAAVFASSAAAGVSGAGMIMLPAVLSVVGIPADMIMILYAADRIFDMGRTCLNVTGDISCSLCVSYWENQDLEEYAEEKEG